MKCEVLLKFTYRNHLDQLIDYTENFGVYPVFINYLRWMPDKAMAIRRIPLDQEKMKVSRTTNVRLSIMIGINETHLKDFNELASFLEAHSAIAKNIGYFRETTS